MLRSSQIGVATGTLLKNLWGTDGPWTDKLQRAALLVTAGQVRAAGLAQDYAAAQGATGDLYANPQQDYTRRLFDAAPAEYSRI